MILWLDAHLSPRTARRISDSFNILSTPLRDLGLRDAEDEAIFLAARKENACIVTKDADFVRLLEQMGSPPKVIWLTCGNTSEKSLQEILQRHLTTAIGLLESGEDLVEIGSL